MSLNLQQLCRACLRSGQTLSSPLDSISIGPRIDRPPSSVVDLWQMFSKMLTTTEGSFPNKICTECNDEIHRTYSFMLKCARSYDILKGLKNVEIRLKRLGSVSSSPEQNISKNIKFENDLYEYVEWNDSENENAKKDIVSEKIQTIIPANVEVPAVETDLRPQHTLIIKHENDKFEIQILDHMSCGMDVTDDEVSAVQEIKQEHDLSTEDEVESDDEPNTKHFTCPGCDFECGMMDHHTYIVMEKHIIDNHIEGQTCKLCNQEFECSTVEHCSQHLLKSSDRRCLKEVRPFNCEQCSKSFLYKSNLNSHMKLHIGEYSKCTKEFKCEICRKSFTRNYHLLRHSKLCKGERPFQCKFCSKSFSDKTVSNRHSKIHTGQRTSKCEICLKTFSEKTHLKRHLGRHKKRPFRCETCPKAFVHEYQLLDHSKNHPREGPVKCEICLKIFSYPHRLKRHSKVHTGERPFKCEICSMTFAEKATLKRHLGSHKDRPFKCETCSNAFEHEYQLLNHSKHHSRERPFKCEICWKNFSEEIILKRHLDWHRRERPFKCETCPKSFVHKYGLLKHSRRHTEARNLSENL